MAVCIWQADTVLAVCRILVVMAAATTTCSVIIILIGIIIGWCTIRGDAHYPVTTKYSLQLWVVVKISAKTSTRRHIARSIIFDNTVVGSVGFVTVTSIVIMGAVDLKSLCHGSRYCLG